MEVDSGWICSEAAASWAPSNGRDVIFFLTLAKGQKSKAKSLVCPIFPKIHEEPQDYLSTTPPHPQMLQNPSKSLALWKLWWRDQFTAQFSTQPNTTTDFRNFCERTRNGKYMEKVQSAWFQLQQNPCESGHLLVAFFSQKHKFSRKPSPWRRFAVMAANRLLFRKWHLRHCRLPENLRNLKSPHLLEAPFCLLKSLHFCFPRCSWHPQCLTMYHINLCSLSRAYHIYL